MERTGYTLFATAIGACGIAWNRPGITALQLAEASCAATRRRLQQRCPGLSDVPAPPEVGDAIRGVVALLEGELVDLAAVILDFATASAWDRAVYRTVRTIPAGEIRTYGEVAADLGDRTLARDVGQALGRNRIPIIMPCHRVTAARGKTGGFSARGGAATKLRLLAIESAHATQGMPLFHARPGMAPVDRAE